jgi:hypothetical protein
MSVQRIDNPSNHTHGWQARAHVAPGWRLTRFFADDANGGTRSALSAAEQAEISLKRKAKRIKNKGRE